MNKTHVRMRDIMMRVNITCSIFDSDSPHRYTQITNTFNRGSVNFVWDLLGHYSALVLYTQNIFYIFLYMPYRPILTLLLAWFIKPHRFMQRLLALKCWRPLPWCKDTKAPFWRTPQAFMYKEHSRGLAGEISGLTFSILPPLHPPIPPPFLPLENFIFE